MSAQEPILRARNLTKDYDSDPSVRRKLLSRTASQQTKPPAADSVSFDVARGEMFVIMGLSGSGKSTVLRMLNRLVEPTSGTVVVDGTDISGAAPKELRRIRNRTINMVFQHFAIFPHRTVLENVAYGLQVRGLSRRLQADRAMWALNAVGLEKCKDSFPAALSGGMRQRVGLARALATDAEVLLMDEPFSALDPLIRRDMQDLLLKLQHELSKTIVFVTHDLNEAMRLGDRIMVMRDGKVVQIDTASAILARPADDYVADFVSDVDRSRVVPAESVMRDPLITVTPDVTCADALEKVANAEAHGAYVVSASGALVGAVSAEELASAQRRGGRSLEGLDLTDYVAVHRSTILMDTFPHVGRHCVPLGVVDDDNKLVGVISRAALLKALSGAKENSHA